MKFTLTTLFVLLTSLLLAQQKSATRTKYILGLSAPELLHTGITYRIANISLVGVSVGAGPTMGGVWTTINVEHRLYFGENSVKTNQKTLFFRQGTTFFPSARSAQKFTLNLTIGKDFVFKNVRNGITMDVGVFYLPESERSSIILVRSLNLWPALRFEFYF